MESKVLRMTLSNSEPVDLIDFTRSCQAFADEFIKFSSMQGESETSVRLQIKEIRSGSIEIDLIPFMAAATAVLSPTQAMAAFNTVASFARNLGSTIDWLKGARRTPELPADRKTLQNITEWLEPVAKDSGAKITLQVVNINVDGDMNDVPIILNNPEANICQNVAKRKDEEMRTPNIKIHEQVLLRWHQSRNNTLVVGDMAIISSITPKPKRVVFQNKSMKALLLTANENLFLRTYLADVIVESVEGVPKLYRIQNIEPIDDDDAEMDV